MRWCCLPCAHVGVRCERRRVDESNEMCPVPVRHQIQNRAIPPIISVADLVCRLSHNADVRVSGRSGRA